MRSESGRIWTDPRDGKAWLVRTHYGVSVDPATPARVAPRLITFQHPASGDLPVKEIRSTRLRDGDPAGEMSDHQLMRLLDQARAAGGG